MKWITITGFIFGVLLLLLALVFLILAPIAGILILVSSFFVLPPIYHAIFAKKVSLGISKRVAIAIVLLILGFIVLGLSYPPKDENYYNWAKRDLDSTYCQKISENDLKQQCLNEINSAFQQYQSAISDSNMAFCELISFDSGKTKCISEVTKIIQKSEADKKLAEEQAKKAEEAAEKAVEEAKNPLNYQGNPNGKISVRMEGLGEYRLYIYNDDFFDYTGVQIVLGEKFICDLNKTISKRSKLQFKISDCTHQGFPAQPREVFPLIIKTEQGNTTFIGFKN